MRDHQNDQTFNRADCVPPYFTLSDPFDKRDATRIVENELRGFKIDAMLRPVDLIFRLVPFDPHLYLQCSTYKYVMSTEAFD